MLHSFREVAQGKWHGILVSLGFQPEMLNGKHQACPVCGGGVDRFRFDDSKGSGSYFCSQCGPGYGIDLVMKVKGLDFKEAAKEVERAAGFVKSEAHKPAKSDEDKIVALRRVWKESRPITQGDEVWRYLEGRGLPVPPKSAALRFHPNLFYRDGEETGRYPAMLALITAPDGSGASIHRTYLKDGKKALVAKPKKIMSGNPISGAAVRLSPVEACLGIAEGIETAMAASDAFSVPVWAAISAAGMEGWIPPEEARVVRIFGDNDMSFTGQKAAYVLAHRLTLAGLEVSVELPARAGTDWADR
jgi:putative DNA primase/helicase